MHGFANPKRFLSLASLLTPIFLIGGLLVSAGALWWGLTQVSPDRLMGETVRILFLHVPAAWLGMGGWTAIALSSLVFLVWRHPLAALAARAAAVPGLVFTLICLITGSIWGRPTWGTWWVWDGRLTSMLVLAFLYVAYIALAQAAEREGVSARIPAIFGLLGAINIPIINRSVVWWNSLHQPPSITMGQSAIDAEFLVPLLIAVFGFSLLFAGVVLARMRALLADVQAEARLRRRAMEAV
ncbi:heme ABC transporter permease CcmC [Qipengyuania citrea]|jgi:heme exporter protein C|uniref:Heme exporter protein C n=1 Tax=Qipengyuania citrea TaxID=225971 RepID=A0ABY4U271_9SPHN|nr:MULTISPECIES: heme ABC transporter permease CcmC [Qipengyuania]MAB46255.1 heme ABC transporter permease [Sphingomonadaceae bacterium]MBL4896234.1 cytochrome c biogenesis protein CcsA [Erythrobacter sp.]QPL38407.1 cytochrome c biogenesis protein CcsA [Erythrobacter sp. A30-3]MAQ66302.1 heme ABC transporter permease [Sphingomonadaceae bacterium]MBY8334878.1 heme ABC transporter permease CcmC [Qipengyuania pacifica]|tara:strand:- start:3095 stop:3817 length:723 start_codon:yes stop_codon:yes gene_type:complete